jgi:hypothetical protein
MHETTSGDLGLNRDSDANCPIYWQTFVPVLLSVTEHGVGHNYLV